MSYPANLGGLKVGPLGRAIDRIQSGDNEIINQDALLESPILFQMSETVRGALADASIDQFSPRGAMAADLVYENVYMASIARWQATGGSPDLSPQLAYGVIDFIRDLLDGLWPL
jgi:hypothetical protein